MKLKPTGGLLNGYDLTGPQLSVMDRSANVNHYQQKRPLHKPSQDQSKSTALGGV